MSFIKSIGVLVGASALVFTLGCGAVDQAVDCNKICNRYKSCFDKDYNVDTCETSCRDRAKNDSDFRRKTDTCNACITDQSCAGATFSCASECSSVVP